MELEKAIIGRKSVRSFEEKKVPRKLLKKLIATAVNAPSSCNRQPWIFYVVDSTKKRNAIALILRETLSDLESQIIKKSVKIQKVLYNFYDDLGGAQNIIFIYRKKIKSEPAYVLPGDIASIACAAENIMLSAVQEGLGTCWVGSFKGPIVEKKLSKILSIQKNDELVASIVIGYPSKDFKPLKRTKKKVSEILNFV
jgi:nitroreductase